LDSAAKDGGNDDTAFETRPIAWKGSGTIGTNTGAINPGTMADDATVGTGAWTNPDNAKVSDDIYTTSLGVGTSGANLFDSEIKIVKSNGSIGATNKSVGAAWNTTQAYYSYGGSADLWGETWANTDINDIDFGVVLSIRKSEEPDIYSHYLKATNFGFSIPSGATINGILVEIERFHANDPQGLSQVDHIRITVYYTTSI